MRKSIFKFVFFQSLFSQYLHTNLYWNQSGARLSLQNTDEKKRGSYGVGGSGSSSSDSGTIAGAVIGSILFVILSLYGCYRYGLCARIFKTDQKQQNESANNTGAQAGYSITTHPIRNNDTPQTSSNYYMTHGPQNIGMPQQAMYPQNPLYPGHPVTNQNVYQMPQKS